jgi:hypothetical protein
MLGYHRRRTRFLVLAVVLGVVATCACGGSNNNGGNAASASDPTSAIAARMKSLVSHIDSGDAKAILDDDVPASARRSCSDKDARDTVNAYRQLFPSGSKLVAGPVSNISTSGNKATASVSVGVSGAPPPGPISIHFVKDGGSWKLDPSGSNGCTGLVPSGLG